MAEQQPSRSKADRIERLRKRLENMTGRPGELAAIIKGILDLLADEL